MRALGLYVHLPWCVRKCPYCDFNSHRAPAQLPAEAYLAALERDLEFEAADTAGRRVESVFFGGGTPSLFAPGAFARLLERIARHWSLADTAEITLEVNPGTVEHAPFGAYRAAGINRVSLGIQSFDDDALRRLGRIHGAAEAQTAARAALAADFTTVNLDLMFGLPEQTLGGALTDLDHALALAPAHISHYQLTIEPNTLFATSPPVLPDDELRWAIQEQCQAALAAAGYAQYEVSAYARGGMTCRHNLNYWRYGDYLGVGAGAHGKLSDGEGVRRRVKQRHPRGYMTSAGGPDSLIEERRVDPAERLFEFALNALRLREGFRTEEFEAATGLELDPRQPPWSTAVRRGLLEAHDERWRPTEQGWNFLNDLIALFLPEDPAP